MIFFPEIYELYLLQLTQAWPCLSTEYHLSVLVSNCLVVIHAQSRVSLDKKAPD